MSTLLRLISITSILVLPMFTGCIAVNSIENVVKNNKDKYKAPTSGQTANVRTFFSDVQTIKIYPNSVQKADLKKDKDAGTVATNRFISGINSVDFEKKSIGMPFAPNDRTFSEHKAVANKPFVISMQYVSGDQKGNYVVTTRCKNRYFVVTLEPNKNYGVDVNATNKKCDYRVFEYLPNGKEKRISIQPLAK